MDHLLRRRPVLALAVLATACAAPPQHDYAPGTPSSTVVQGMGSPSAEYKSPAAGGRRLEYAGGTYGRRTYMFDFDEADRLVRANQVWTEGYFNTIQTGMSADDVLVRIGKPSTTWAIAWQRQKVWSYRYETPFCQWFMVGMSPEGRVTDTAYGPDPICSRDRDGNAGRTSQ